MNNTQAQPTFTPPTRKRILRSQDDRIIGGVAGGLGQSFDVDPLIFRILFAIGLIFLTIPTALMYLACVLLIPNNLATPTSAVSPSSGSRRYKTIGLLFLAAAVVIPIFAIGSFSIWTFDHDFFTNAYYGMGFHHIFHSIVPLVVIAGLAVPFFILVGILCLLLSRVNNSDSNAAAPIHGEDNSVTPPDDKVHSEP